MKREPIGIECSTPKLVNLRAILLGEGSLQGALLLRIDSLPTGQLVKLLNLPLLELLFLLQLLKLVCNHQGDFVTSSHTRSSPP
jgi:hypothetical protein